MKYQGVSAGRLRLCLLLRPWLLRLVLLEMFRNYSPAHAQAPLTGTGMRASDYWQSFARNATPHTLSVADTFIYSLGAGFGLEANDNVNLSETRPEKDLILRPSFRVDLSYSLTKINTLTLNLNIEYAKYIKHPELDTFLFNTQGLTGINLDLHVGETRINLHSGFSLRQDPLAEGEISGQANYRRFTNATGFEIEPEYERLHLQFGYDHIIDLYNEQFKDQNRSVESAYSEVGYKVGESALYALKFAGAYINPSPGVLHEGFTYSVSLEGMGQVSDYLRVQAEAGYAGGQFLDSTDTSDSSSASTFFGGLGIQHRLNHWITQSVEAGSDLLPSIHSNYRQVEYAGYHISFNAIRGALLYAEVFYQHSVNSLILQSEVFDSYGVGANLSFHVARKTNAALSYRFTTKRSNLADSSYTQNQLLLSFTRQF